MKVKEYLVGKQSQINSAIKAFIDEQGADVFSKIYDDKVLLADEIEKLDGSGESPIKVGTDTPSSAIISMANLMDAVKSDAKNISRRMRKTKTGFNTRCLPKRILKEMF